MSQTPDNRSSVAGDLLGGGRPRAALLEGPLYVLGLLWIFLPLLDAARASWPAGGPTLQWRFGATVMVSRALLTPSAGLLLIALGAVMNNRRGLARTVFWVTTAAMLAIIAAMGLFALDAVQVYGGVPPQSKRGMLVTAGQATLALLGSLTLLFTLVVALRRVLNKGTKTQRQVVLQPQQSTT